LRGGSLLIAIERAPPAENHFLAIGIAGHGFHGNLTSDSTRLEGYVLSTDIAPTILHWFGIATPAEMSGQPIGAKGTVDAAVVESLDRRLAVISPRRGPVIGVSLLIWLTLLALSFAVGRDRGARWGIQPTGLSVIYLPLALLLCAAVEPGQGTEQVIVLIGAPLLALLTLAVTNGYRALALASATVVFAYAIDVIAGSPLTLRSLLGPNPGLGVRFYGIGNELEALLAVLVIAGTGAAIAGFAPRLAPKRCAIAFLTAAMLTAAVFASGRFGADVGAAIVLPLGGTVAAIVVAARSRLGLLAIAAAPLLGIGLLSIADLASDANAHLTRSVLETGGLHDLADLVERRLRLSAHSFTRPIVLFFLPLTLGLALVAIAKRDRIDSWFLAYPAMRAGLLGAAAATVVGTVANDSGALLLEIGTAYLLVFVGFAWSVGTEGGPKAG
jgi:hypothetical protein